ncbi:FAD dependent oxidoreductase [Legionella massiliensis]|uniref:FAD dependent oxidoreductase n=1 Tax=Legionella massiliensis TaxID=1034943 RepID=A0A078KZM4_9GAMM|nr:FAD-dependent oxidoreductase [Legionella massiliensis]CDZ78427.1 FAD dependent oxidoreductase [Legionella massiliensis]CEE14165.1 FAD dependent oxidoreductase [Legionella massiliensis]
MKKKTNLEENYPQHKLVIIGGGIVAAIEAYFAYLDAKDKNTPIRVIIYEKNKALSETTTSHLVPSLTPDEIFVVPRGQELVKLLQSNEICVDDEEGIYKSEVAEQFIKKLKEYSTDEEGHQIRTKTLLELGKMSMKLWQHIYDNADSKLKAILEESNFNPCRESKTVEGTLHDGYRIDLIYKDPNAKRKASTMISNYQELGYINSKVLSPKEVMEKDLFLTDFCKANSTIGEHQWKEDVIALWRPGGCIDTQVFLPKFYAYLSDVMGRYTNQHGELKPCFHLKFDRNVTGVTYSSPNTISGVLFFDRPAKAHKHQYDREEYVFCPGESVGTLKKLGFDEPAYSGFAGVSLKLNIRVNEKILSKYKQFNHYMEIHQEGLTLAWQGRVIDNMIFIGAAGAKSFSSDQKPHKDQAFARNNNLLQLNVMNEILPQIISIALGRNTEGQQLTAEDLIQLEQNGIAERWVGIRAVAFDGYPTIGAISNSNGLISNARCTTHLGSCGASFAPAAVHVSRSIFSQQADIEDLTNEVLSFGKTMR